jgi:hypothetical protein
LFGLIQALIFTILTIIYIQLAVSGHGDAHSDEAEHEDERLTSAADHMPL